jgi:hypothetical protein
MSHGIISECWLKIFEARIWVTEIESEAKSIETINYTMMQVGYRIVEREKKWRKMQKTGKGERVQRKEMKKEMERERRGKSNSCSSMCLPHTGMHLRMPD